MSPPQDAIYFGSRDAVVCSKRRSWLVRARLRLFMLMFRNSVRAVDLFNSPGEFHGSRPADRDLEDRSSVLYFDFSAIHVPLNLPDIGNHRAVEDYSRGNDVASFGGCHRNLRAQ
jgi:hypothetical protein